MSGRKDQEPDCTCSLLQPQYDDGNWIGDESSGMTTEEANNLSRGLSGEILLPPSMRRKTPSVPQS